MNNTEKSYFNAAQFKIETMTGEEVIILAHEINGGGVNTTIPMTLRPCPALTKKQKIRDSQIVKEICYLHDVINEKDRAVEKFFENKHRLSDPSYWEMLRTMWIANGKMENLNAFKQMFQSKRPFKRFLMTIEEESAFNELPDIVIAYRVQAKSVDIGISWTLSREFVEQYAKKLNRVIIERQFQKTKIIAYFNRRDEQEIIVL